MEGSVLPQSNRPARKEGGESAEPTGAEGISTSQPDLLPQTLRRDDTPLDPSGSAGGSAAERRALLMGRPLENNLIQVQPWLQGGIHGLRIFSYMSSLMLEFDLGVLVLQYVA